MATPPNLADLRKNYTHGGLSEADAGGDPVALFREWFDAALGAGLPEPNAMTLATADAAGRPEARIVLLKGVDDQGFVFFSNYHSHKGQSLDARPFAALCFLWHEFERQVRVAGACRPVPADESDAYFATRPRGSQLAAWASAQSEILPDRAVLDANLRDLEARFPGEVPRPPHWGGYLVVPETIEFWQGRPSRMHDRIRFRRATPQSAWQRDRLSP